MSFPVAFALVSNTYGNQTQPFAVNGSMSYVGIFTILGVFIALFFSIFGTSSGYCKLTELQEFQEGEKRHGQFQRLIEVCKMINVPTEREAIYLEYYRMKNHII